tara:strand:+ start:937 stop:1920 length:984 start_codon:yes stop_codon:yes gene_type:complete
MKLTTKQIKQLIKEELQAIIESNSPASKQEKIDAYLNALQTWDQKSSQEPQAYAQEEAQLLGLVQNGQIEDFLLLASDLPHYFARLLDITKLDTFPDPFDEELITLVNMLFKRREDWPGGYLINDYGILEDIAQGFKFSERKKSKDRKKQQKNKEMCAKIYSQWQGLDQEWNRRKEGHEIQVDQIEKEIRALEREARFEFNRDRKDKVMADIRRAKSKISSLKHFSLEDPNLTKKGRLLDDADARNCPWAIELYIPVYLKLMKKKYFKKRAGLRIGREESETMALKILKYAEKHQIDLRVELDKVKGSNWILDQYAPQEYKYLIPKV